MLRGRLPKCLSQAGFSLRAPPELQRVSAQLPRRPDMRESVICDARRAAHGPREGVQDYLGRGVRHVVAGARGAPARALSARPPRGQRRRRRAAVEMRDGTPS